MKLDKLGHVGPFRRIATPRLSGETRRLVGRLMTQEYLPLAAWVLAWAAIAAQLGLADTARLVAANGFFQSVRSLVMLQSYGALSSRLGVADAEARRLAVRTDGAAVVLTLALLGLLAGGLHSIGLAQLAGMALLLAIGLPARTPCALFVAHRHITASWRLGSAATLLAGAAVILALDLGWVWAALLLGLREWGGLLATFLLGKRRSPDLDAMAGPLQFPEIASRTSMMARRRLVYRVTKTMFGILGPLSGVIVRTGRGIGLDARIAQRLPIRGWNIGLLAFIGIGASVGLVIAVQEPAALVIASALARIGAAAGSVLIWWRWHGPEDAWLGWQDE